ncbi:hypothetical protein D3C71_1325030 [compost metagenome]
MQAETILDQTIENGLGVVKDLAVRFDFFVGLFGKHLDVIVALAQRVHDILQFQLVAGTLFTLHMALFGARLIAQVVHE